MLWKPEIDAARRRSEINPMTKHDPLAANDNSLDVPALAASLRSQTPLFARWAAGYGAIRHEDATQVRIYGLVEKLVKSGKASALDEILEKLIAADRLASAAMWLVAHMTYASTVDPGGRELQAEDFKAAPEGHTGGSLNAVPAYVGYMLANVLTATTRSWVLGPGHCVAAIEAVNVLLGNVTPAQRARYSRSAEGLTRLVRDFYSYAIDASGAPAVPLGSHVNPHTAGAVLEGGYLGFAEVEYVHMPLKGESLVAFLSDGAFEEQRGSDWSSRWWRANDSGLVIPVMILNGRRIEERSEILQEGGAEWLDSYLALNSFDPVNIDGRDPAAFAWAIIEGEGRLEERGRQALAEGGYPVRLPYVVARTIKGYGFPGAGTNRAHNLPLPGNPREDALSRAEFNAGAKTLWVSPAEIECAVSAFNVHAEQERPREADHPVANRRVPSPAFPDPVWAAPGAAEVSPMDAIDSYFVALLKANPQLRPRVGNPDELASNRMGQTLALLKHRVNSPEAGVAEAIDGAIITALNEEAVIGAALGNKGGINLAVTYEAFAVKMLGALRQDIIFARHQKEFARAPGWIGIPLIAASHTWENGKNEQSHQDTTIGEALLAEMSDVSRVLFPFDANTAVEALRQIYASHGQIGCLIVAKRPLPVVAGAAEAAAILGKGAGAIRGAVAGADVQLAAIGAYQVQEALKAANWLEKKGIAATVTAIVEPGRLREPRDGLEGVFTLSDEDIAALFPESLPRVVVTHTRPEPILGVLRRIDGGPRRMRALGYINRGGTLDVAGMLFANRCTWAHIAEAAGALIGATARDILDGRETLAIEGRGDPAAVMHGAP